ncbi:MAG: OmpA family protein [Rectinemataceae bacterium]|nr:OmpA family protein [Rectinemataceae bacterium]
MKRIARTLLSIVWLFLLIVGVALAEEDRDGKDHPLFNRMPGTWIYSYKAVDFDAHTFRDEKGNKINVEGRYYYIHYYPEEGTPQLSKLKILRNYENAVKKIGGIVLKSDFEDASYMKLVKGGKEIWVEVRAVNGQEPQLIIIEKEAMAQEIVANAEAFSNDLKEIGHTAVYGIFFDTGQSVIKPESEAAMSEIAKLLKKEAGLKVNVVGHTDNVGGMDSNMKLSQSRADAVVQVLVGKYGIGTNRLKAYGVGPLAPVASNDTEEGKAKNRRVELVKQ